jgi:hypothetical protein
MGRRTKQRGTPPSDPPHPAPPAWTLGFGLIGAVSLFAVSIVVVALLGAAAWIVPITFFHLAALAHIRPGLRLLGLTSKTVKVGSLFYAFPLAIVAAGASSNSENADLASLDAPATTPPPTVPASPAPVPTVPASPAPAPSAPPAPQAPPLRDVSTTVDEMLQIYADNQIAGERKFANARVKISGTTVRVREALGTGILVLGSQRSAKRLELYFSKEGNQSLSEITPGQRVEAECYSVLEMLGEVLVGDCRSVK